jgi:hypothetical protein
VARKRIDDWTAIESASVEIRRYGSIVCSGIVDSVIGDGAVLWMVPCTEQEDFTKETAAMKCGSVTDPTALYTRL